MIKLFSILLLFTIIFMVCIALVVIATMFVEKFGIVYGTLMVSVLYTFVIALFTLLRISDS